MGASRQCSKTAFWLQILPGALKIRQESIYLAEALFLMRTLEKKIQTSGAAVSSDLGQGLQVVSGGWGQDVQCCLRTGITGIALRAGM